MFIYLFRRILYIIPIIFGVALIVFALFNLVGGDPTYQMLGKHANPQLIEELRSELGLDQPKWKQFIDYLGQIVTFDFGRSYSTKQRISDMILQGIGPTLAVTIPAATLTLIVSILLSLLAAYFRGRWIDKIVVVICVIGMSVPALAYILFGQYFLAYKFGFFPISGFDPSFPDFVSYVSLPVVIWLLVSLGTDVRFFRTAILDETYQDYVRTARAKGISEPWVFLKHVLRNSLVPIITYTVIQIPYLVLGSVLLESFFGIPGLGTMIVDGINNSDFPVLKAMATVVSLLYILANLVTDVLYVLVDPRVSLK